MKNKFILTQYLAEKGLAHKIILEAAKKEGDMLEFFGGGQSERKARRMGIDVFSIDNGKSYPKEDREELKKEMESKSYRAFTDLKCLSMTEKERKWGCFNMDYCGKLSKSVRSDLTTLRNIMKERGTIWVTLFMGREGYVEKGTPREEINRATIRIITDHLSYAEVETKHICTLQYKGRRVVNNIQPKKDTNMILFGFEFIRKY